MKLFLVGGTGRTGQFVTRQAIARGHSVTAIVRKPTVPPAQQHLDTVIGDPLSVEHLVPILPGHDAVVSCLGQRSRKDASLMQDAAAAMLEAMRRTGLQRYLVVSQGLLFASWNPIIALLRRILARHVADSMAMERLVRTSDTDWTIVRPPRLLNDAAAHGYRLRVGGRPDGAWSMQRADLATFLIDEAETGAHMRAIIGLTSGLSGSNATQSLI
jgi:putative NADH-flavin reductase